MAGGEGVESGGDSGILTGVGDALRSSVHRFRAAAGGLVASFGAGGRDQQSNRVEEIGGYKAFITAYGAESLVRTFQGYDPAEELPDEIAHDILRRSDAVIPLIHRTLSERQSGGLALPDREIVINEAHPTSTRERVPGFLRAAFGHRLRALVQLDRSDDEDPAEVIANMTVILEAMMSDQRRRFPVPPLDRSNPVFGSVAEAYWLLANSKL